MRRIGLIGLIGLMAASALGLARTQSPRGALTFFTQAKAGTPAPTAPTVAEAAPAELAPLTLRNFWVRPATNCPLEFGPSDLMVYREWPVAGLGGTNIAEVLSETWCVSAPLTAGFEFNTETGKVYRVECRNLTEAENEVPDARSWRTVSEPIAGTGSNVSFSQGAPLGAAIYRVTSSAP